jgi:hypothetical protein
MNNTPLNTKNLQSLEALERIWIECKTMQFGYYGYDVQEDITQ